MNTTPLVSVVIPVYNAAKSIAETLKSVIEQNWKNLEIIVVNDGSTDNSLEIIRSFHDVRIRIIDQKNYGCSGAKNAGLSIATGDYIQYLDADDILSNNKIQEQVELLERNQRKIAVCRTMRFTGTPLAVKENEIDTEFLYSTDHPLEFLLNLYGMNGRIAMIQPNAFLLPAEICRKAGNWNVSISPSPDEDGEYFCRMILECEGIVYTPGSVNFYRVNSEGSLSKQHSYKYAQGALMSIELRLEHLLKIENSERVRSVMAVYFSTFIYVYFDLYPELIHQAKQKLKEIGFNKIPPAGGENFKKLSSIIGMDSALKLRRIIKKVSGFKAG